MARWHDGTLFLSHNSAKPHDVHFYHLVLKSIFCALSSFGSIYLKW